MGLISDNPRAALHDDFLGDLLVAAEFSVIKLALMMSCVQAPTPIVNGLVDIINSANAKTNFDMISNNDIDDTPSFVAAISN